MLFFPCSAAIRRIEFSVLYRKCGLIWDCSIYNSSRCFSSCWCSKRWISSPISCSLLSTSSISLLPRTIVTVCVKSPLDKRRICAVRRSIGSEMFFDRNTDNATRNPATTATNRQPALINVHICCPSAVSGFCCNFHPVDGISTESSLVCSSEAGSVPAEKSSSPFSLYNTRCSSSSSNISVNSSANKSGENSISKSPRLCPVLSFVMCR